MLVSSTNQKIFTHDSFNGLRTKRSRSVKVKVAKQKPVTLSLPIMIGTSVKSDVFIASSESYEKEFGYIVSHRDDRLVFFNIQTKSISNSVPKEFTRLKIKLTGPYADNPSALTLKEKFLLAEKRIAASVPEVLTKYYGSNLEQASRLKILGMAGVVLASAITTSILTPEPVKIAKVPMISLSYNTPTAKGAIYRPNVGGNKDGIKVQFEVPEKYRKIEQILSYKSVNLDIAGEIKVYANGTLVSSSTVRPDCLTTVCEETAVIDYRLIPESGQVTVFFDHTAKDSSYAVAQMKLFSKPEWDETEKYTYMNSLKYATRLYNERWISHHNLIKSSDEIVKIKEFNRVRTTDGSFEAQVNSLAGLIGTAKKDEIKKIEYDIKRKYELMEFHDVIGKYKQLLDFYPDLASSKNIEIRKEIRRIEGML